jgi:hypothetical protein
MNRFLSTVATCVALISSASYAESYADCFKLKAGAAFTDTVDSKYVIASGKLDERLVFMQSRSDPDGTRFVQTFSEDGRSLLMTSMIEKSGSVNTTYTKPLTFPMNMKPGEKFNTVVMATKKRQDKSGKVLGTEAIKESYTVTFYGISPYDEIDIGTTDNAACLFTLESPQVYGVTQVRYMHDFGEIYYAEGRYGKKMNRIIRR